MATNTAVASRAIYAKEPTKNTREVPDHHLATYVSSNFQQNVAHIPSQALGSGLLTEGGFAVGNRNPAGTLVGELIPESMGEMFELWMGANVTAGAGPYTHTSNPAAPLPTATIQTIPVDSTDGTERPIDLIGAMCSTWEISCDATGDGAMVVWTSDWLANDAVTDQTAVPAALPTPTYLTSVQASVTLASGGLCVDSFTFGGDNNLRSDVQACATNPGRPLISDSGFRTYTASVVADFTDYVNHDRIAAGTEAALVFEITANVNAKLVTTMNVRTVGDTPIIEGPGIIKQPLNFVATGSTPITNVLTNSDSAA